MLIYLNMAIDNLIDKIADKTITMGLIGYF